MTATNNSCCCVLLFFTSLPETMAATFSQPPALPNPAAIELNISIFLSEMGCDHHPALTHSHIMLHPFGLLQ